MVLAKNLASMVGSQEPLPAYAPVTIEYEAIAARQDELPPLTPTAPELTKIKKKKKRRTKSQGLFVFYQRTRHF